MAWISGKNYQSVLDYLAITFTVLAFLCACFMPANVAPTRLENFILPLAILALLFKDNIKIDIILVSSLFIYFFLSVISVLINEPDMVKFSYTIRIFKFFVFFILACNIINNHLKILDITIRVALIFTATVMLLEVFNPFGIGDSLFSFYTHHKFEKFNVLGGRRIIGTMQNPNDNAVLILCFTAYFMSSYYYKKKILDLFFVLSCVVLIILAQSRTTIIALIFMGIGFLVNFKLNRQILLGLLIFVLLIPALMYFLKIDYLMQVFTKNPLEIGELRARFPIWQYMYEVWKENVFFGKGPFAYNLTYDITHIWPPKAPDSEYIYVLASKGLFGFIAFLCLLIFPVITLWKRRKESLHAMLGILLPVGFSVIALTNFTILNVRIGIIYFILIGIPISILIYDKKNPYRFSKTIPGITNLFKKRTK